MVKNHLNNSILDKVDIIELTTLGAGLKKVITSLTMDMWNFVYYSASRQLCQGSSWVHEVRAQEEVGSRNALSDIITTSHMWI